MKVPEMPIMAKGLSNDHPYSATRFAWPITLPARFGRIPHVAEGEKCWRLCKNSDWPLEEQQARKRYFTEETRRVIFGHDNWWILDVEQQVFKIPMPGAREVEAIMLPPALVAFEADSRFNILRSGFLLIEVQMKGDWQLEDLLLFNELFRYTREPWADHSRFFGAQMKSFLQPISTMLGVDVDDAYEGRWQALMPRSGGGGKASNPVWSYADDRAFTWTRAITKEPSLLVCPAEIPQTSAISRTQEKKAGAPETEPKSPATPDNLYAGWIKLLNIDRPWIDNNLYDATQTWTVSRFELEWGIPRTYRRWEHAGTFYGFTDFSGAMLTTEDSFAWKHWSQMYFDTAVLLLYLRLTLFRFSAELAEFTKMMSSSGRMQPWRGRFLEFRKAFTILQNLYQFPLLSTQQQSLEMYVLMRKAISVQELYEEVAQEVRGSDELLENLIQQQRSSLGFAISTLGVLGFGAGTGLAMFGITGLPKWLLGFLHLDQKLSAETGEMAAAAICVASCTLVYAAAAGGIYRWAKRFSGRTE